MNCNNPLDTFDPAATWQGLSPDDQARIGALALDVVFAGFVSGSAYAPEDRLFDPSVRTIAEHRSDEMLLELYMTIETALPSLFGAPGQHPAWATVTAIDGHSV